MAALANPLPYLSSVGWTCIGITASAALGYFPWTAARSQLPSDAQVQYAYVSPLLVITAVAALVLAIFCFVVNKIVRQMRTATASSVCDDMDAIYAPHKKPDPPAASDAHGQTSVPTA